MLVSFTGQEINKVSIYIIYDLVKGNVSESFISSHKGKDDFIKGTRRKDRHKMKSSFLLWSSFFFYQLAVLSSNIHNLQSFLLSIWNVRVCICIFIFTFYSTSALPMLNVKRIRLLSFEVFYLSHVRSFLFE